jgi:hypothetical protein
MLPVLIDPGQDRRRERRTRRRVTDVHGEVHVERQGDADAGPVGDVKCQAVDRGRVPAEQGVHTGRGHPRQVAL